MAYSDAENVLVSLFGFVVNVQVICDVSKSITNKDPFESVP